MKIILGAWKTPKLSDDDQTIYLGCGWGNQFVARGWRVVYLGPLEFRMAAALLANLGRPVYREDLVAHSYGDVADGGPLDTVRTFNVRRFDIRKKLLCLGVTFSVHTGRGYEAHVV